jgi:class 3 adenylate cyclase
MNTNSLTAGVAEQLASMKVLVVDDSRTLRKLMSMALTNLGINHILEAADGEEAIAKIKSETFDLMLLDMEMPGLNGLETLRVIKGTEDLQYLPVIVVSGTEDFEKTIECIEAGAEDYLPKPFNSVLLRARVLSSLEKKRLRDLDRLRIRQLQHEQELLHLEQLKSEKLMLNILPKPIAERLMRGEINISSSYEAVTIIFSDLVGFTKMSSQKSPADLVKLLNDLVSRFDRRADELGVLKIKTIGDSYMAAGGLPIPRSDHAHIVADFALGMIEDLKAFNSENNAELELRIGMNTGPVVAGVIGFTKFAYDLWGNSVNTASRMESTSEVGKIQITKMTRDLIANDFEIQDRGMIECKGLGEVETFFLKGRK